MRDLLFAIAFLLISLFVLFHGVLMLVWPDKHTRFVDWLARSDRWSKRNTDWKPGPQLEKRFAGVATVAMALLMLRLPIHWFLHPRSLAWVKPHVVPRVAFDWFEFAAAAVTVAIGIHMLIMPAAYVGWMVRANPQRLYPDDFVKRGSLGVRVFGSVVAVVGVCLLCFALRR